MPTLALTRLTMANGLRQPLTWLTVGIAVALLALTALFGMFNFIEADRLRLVVTGGVATVTLAALFLGITGAATAVHGEISTHTAATLFAKPLSRAAFVIGKATGCWLVAAMAAALVAMVHVGLVWLVQRYGFAEFGDHHQHDAEPSGWVSYIRLGAGHLLALAHAGVLTAMAACLALRLSPLAAIAISFAAFVLAHLLAGLGWPATLVLPALALCNIDEALQFEDRTLNLPYFLLSLFHCALYSAGWLLIAIAWFRNRDVT